MNVEIFPAPLSKEQESTLSEFRELGISLSNELERLRKRKGPICHLLCELGRFLSYPFPNVPPANLDFRDLEQSVFELLSAIDDRDLYHAEVATANMLHRTGLL